VKLDESYLIDEEAFSVLNLINGQNTVSDILGNYSQKKQDEIKGALETFSELEIISFLSEAPNNIKSKNVAYLDIPNKNPFHQPYLKNLMINITEKCNLECKHCYITNKNPIDMDFKKLKNLINDFYDLQGIKLILTGGEPLVYEKLVELLTYLKKIPLQKVILTNGMLIEDNAKTIGLLKENNAEIFVSLDGLQKTHNEFRNAKCFQKTIDGIKNLVQNGIKTSINTMVHKQNLKEFDEIFKLINSFEGKITNWSIDIPTFDEDIPEQIRSNYKISAEEGGEILKNYGWGEVYESECHNYACGPNLMAIDVVGIVTKCGFFYSQNVGNVFEIGMKKAWERLQKKLNWTLDELECKGCEYLESCRGGCRYRAFKDTGNIRGVDKYKCYQFGKIKNKEK
jgi:radical SAM protein with 4Fe4S-binding SPASM domain